MLKIKISEGLIPISRQLEFKIHALSFYFDKSAMFVYIEIME
jgi:hypothetical protein